jgi:enterobacteria phage integrase
MLRTQHGHRSIVGLSRERIITGILQPYADRPGAALATLKMLRVLIRHSIDIGWLKYDPSLGIKRPKTQEIRSWTDAEIEAFETRWTTGTKQRLAFALMLYTGQRRSDVHRMTWADVSGPTIRVVQQKTRRKLVIPLHHALRKVLAATEREHVTIINTEYGKPYTVGRLQPMDARRDHCGRTSARLPASRIAEGSRAPPRRSRVQRERDHVRARASDARRS